MIAFAPSLFFFLSLYLCVGTSACVCACACIVNICVSCVCGCVPGCCVRGACVCDLLIVIFTFPRFLSISEPPDNYEWGPIPMPYLQAMATCPLPQVVDNNDMGMRWVYLYGYISTFFVSPFIVCFCQSGEVGISLHIVSQSLLCFSPNGEVGISLYIVYQLIISLYIVSQFDVCFSQSESERATFGLSS